MMEPFIRNYRLIRILIQKNVKKKAIPITLPANVLNIMPYQAFAVMMIVTLNVMPPNGVKKTAIIQQPVLCLLL